MAHKQDRRKLGDVSAARKFKEMNDLIETHHRQWYLQHMLEDENTFLTNVCIEYWIDLRVHKPHSQNDLARCMLAAVRKRHGVAA